MLVLKLYLLLVFSAVANAQEKVVHNVKLFRKTNGAGVSFNVTLTYANRTCINLPSEWGNITNSVNSDDMCVDLYSELNCVGKEVEIYPGSDHGNMKLWGFKDMANSIRPCVQHTDFNSPHRNSIILNTNQGTHLRNIKPCLEITPELGTEVQSVTTYNTCFQYYTDNNCRGPFAEFGTTETLIFRSNFRTRIRSIGAGQTCFAHVNTTLLFSEEDVDLERKEEEPSNSTCVDGRTCATLYKSTDFQGENISFQLSYEEPQCITLPNKFRNAVGSAISPMCFKMYYLKDCDGREIQLYPGVNTRDLGQWGLRNLAESIKVCPEHVTASSPRSNIIAIWDVDGEKSFQNVKPCYGLPKHLRTTIDKVYTFNTCFNFYTNDKFCDGAHFELDGKHEVERSYETRLRMVHSIGRCTSKVPLVPEDESNFLMIAALTVAIALLLCAPAMVFLLHRRSKRKYNQFKLELEQRTEKMIEHFMQGNQKVLESLPLQEVDATVRANNMPYDPAKFEIPLKSICMDWKNPLGEGQFGVVLPATVAKLESAKQWPVAVKTLKPGTNFEGVDGLLRECKILMYLAGDKNGHIVNLIGACTENLTNLEVYIIIELCSNGGLLNFLRKHRPTFVNFNSQHVNNLQDFENYTKTNTYHLVKWATEIADGMVYLSFKKVVHGDLAARNVLLDGNFTAKISDFGLSRQLYQNYQYVKTKQVPLPWKWMALECLQDFVFSKESDVWAFGITLWEIFTLGLDPYPGESWTMGWSLKVREGLRPAKPELTTDEMYTLMFQCWNNVPANRPSFEELHAKLSKILEALVRRIRD